MALLYSARLRRCGMGAPGSALASAARSRDSSSLLAKAAVAALSGRGSPAGGMAPVRTWRRTRSHVALLPAAFAGSRPSRMIPPVLSFALWHPAQYWVTRGRGSAAWIGWVSAHASAIQGGADVANWRIWGVSVRSISACSAAPIRLAAQATAPHSPRTPCATLVRTSPRPRSASGLAAELATGRSRSIRPRFRGSGNRSRRADR